MKTMFWTHFDTTLYSNFTGSGEESGTQKADLSFHVYLHHSYQCVRNQCMYWHWWTSFLLSKSFNPERRENEFDITAFVYIYFYGSMFQCNCIHFEVNMYPRKIPLVNEVAAAAIACSSGTRSSVFSGWTGNGDVVWDKLFLLLRYLVQSKIIPLPPSQLISTWVTWMLFYLRYFQANIINSWPSFVLWNCSQVIVTRLLW